MKLVLNSSEISKWSDLVPQDLVGPRKPQPERVTLHSQHLAEGTLVMQGEFISKAPT